MLLITFVVIPSAIPQFHLYFGLRRVSSQAWSHMKFLRMLIAGVWLFLGSALAIYSIVDIRIALGQSLRSEVYAALIFFGFSIVAISGAFGTIRHGQWGPPLLYIGSAFGVFYGGLYWLGGVEDTGWSYATGVGLLILLSLATFVGVQPEVRHV